MASEEYGPSVQRPQETTATTCQAGLEVGLSPVKPSDQTPALTDISISACKGP